MNHITLFPFNCPKASSSRRLDANSWEWVINSPRGSKQQIFWMTQSSSAIGNSTAVFLFNFSWTTNIFNTMWVDLFLLCLSTCLLIPVNQEGPPSCLTFWNIVSSLSLLLQTKSVLNGLSQTISQLVPLPPACVPSCSCSTSIMTITCWRSQP